MHPIWCTHFIEPNAFVQIFCINYDRDSYMYCCCISFPVLIDFFEFNLEMKILNVLRADVYMVNWTWILKYRTGLVYVWCEITSF